MHSNHHNIKNPLSHNTNSTQSKNKHKKQHNESSWRGFLPIKNEESKAKTSWINFSSTPFSNLNFPYLKAHFNSGDDNSRQPGLNLLKHDPKYETETTRINESEKKL
jgi:hypothetical protein